MKRIQAMIVGIALLTVAGCDFEPRLSKLEKENRDLKAKASSEKTVADYDLQAKCSKDAKAWFVSNWERDKDTVLLDYTNHYNKALNKCYIWVEYHYSADKNGSWYKDLMLTDVYENVRFGNFSESHLIYSGKVQDPQVVICDMWDKECKTADEYNNFVRPYLSN